MMGKTTSDDAAGVATSDATYYGEARSWEDSRVLMIERSERRAWRVAAASVVVAVAAVIALALLTPLKSAVPFLVYVDRFSGDTQVHEAMDARVQFSEIIDKHWLLQYVTSRERYYWNLLQSDYDRTMALSDSVPAREYGRQFDGPNALYKKLGRMQEYAVRIISITVMPHAPGAPGLATVRFEKTLRALDSDQPGETQHYVATITYVYRPAPLSSEKTLILNPLGFTVTAYRVAPELAEVLPSGPALPPSSSDATPGTAPGAMMSTMAAHGMAATQGGGAR
ncbi:virB8 family protein [Trinickia acidisoli]|uniref:virB8 family protein n=1 Tax=Trinickia acidisoli TaxID=2767482 RepID=UPI001A90221C|nr:type IV secretion system protein [Trinickia acidisoli]